MDFRENAATKIFRIHHSRDYYVSKWKELNLIGSESKD